MYKITRIIITSIIVVGMTLFVWHSCANRQPFLTIEFHSTNPNAPLVLQVWERVAWEASGMDHSLIGMVIFNELSQDKVGE